MSVNRAAKSGKRRINMKSWQSIFNIYFYLLLGFAAEAQRKVS